MSGAGQMRGRDGSVGVGRALWVAILAALDSDDAALRTEVYAAVIRVGLPAWMDVLDDPAALSAHVREATGGRVTLTGTDDQADGNGGDRGDRMSPGWGPMRPNISPASSPIPMPDA
ncbi:hypothetical protein Acsp04_61340 [Actinomadura sp. NBRC 104425]|uniref:hypothetical protein n=1 Tax=Actinomadura sp. NBRC 104425 TaxID=3032204 RepID=UPI0024A22A3E|nr:hypothetical protein [Actinomadura sp. NBRC 104425]GLZ15899.1 hypothetical protein Acsp04_61340 [Actinomadura sp. NBRC 104425]